MFEHLELWSPEARLGSLQLFSLPQSEIKFEMSEDTGDAGLPRRNIKAKAVQKQCRVV